VLRQRRALFHTAVFNGEWLQTGLTEVIIHDSDPLAFPRTASPVTMRVLKVFSDMGRPLSVEEVASTLSVSMSMVQYCIDVLMERDFIVQTRAGFESSWTERSFPDLYVLTLRGRKYVRERESTS
jgi:hypothetical protein